MEDDQIFVWTGPVGPSLHTTIVASTASASAETNMVDIVRWLLCPW